MNEPTLGELLASILRDAGWIMAGGSAQFREGAVAEMQSSLRLVHLHVSNERVLNAANVLSDKAVQIVANKEDDTNAIMTLRRLVGEFEQAMKAYMATSGRR